MDKKHIEKLTQSTREILEKSSKERIRKCKEQIWIPYPQANTILDELEEFLITLKKIECLIY